LLLWLFRRYEKDIKPGTLFAGWLMAAGVGRVWLELFFRPDQPKIGDSFISYSLVAAALMAVAGTILLMVRYKAINVAFAEDWEEEYQISGQAEPKDEPVEEKKAPRIKKTSTAKAKITTAKKAPARKTTSTTTKKKTTSKTTKKPTTRTKKSS